LGEKAALASHWLALLSTTSPGAMLNAGMSARRVAHMDEGIAPGVLKGRLRDWGKGAAGAVESR